MPERSRSLRRSVCANKTCDAKICGDHCLALGLISCLPSCYSCDVCFGALNVFGRDNVRFVFADIGNRKEHVCAARMAQYIKTACKVSAIVSVKLLSSFLA